MIAVLQPEQWSCDDVACYLKSEGIPDLYIEKLKGSILSIYLLVSHLELKLFCLFDIKRTRLMDPL